MKKQNILRTSGFTLIEILIVIGIIAILAAIVLVAINPARQFRQANNSQRDSNVNAILTALGQYVVDKKGDTSELSELGLSETAEEISSGGVDLCAVLVPQYLPSLPTDPDEDTHKGANIKADENGDCGTYATGYEVLEDENGRITVSAPLTVDIDTGSDAADEDIISATR